MKVCDPFLFLTAWVHWETLKTDLEKYGVMLGKWGAAVRRSPRGRGMGWSGRTTVIAGSCCRTTLGVDSGPTTTSSLPHVRPRVVAPEMAQSAEKSRTAEHWV